MLFKEAWEADLNWILEDPDWWLMVFVVMTVTVSVRPVVTGLNWLTGPAQHSWAHSWAGHHHTQHTNQHFIFSPHSHSPVILTKQIIIIRVYLQKLYCWKYSPHFLTLLPPCPALPTSTVQPSCVSEKIYIWINWLTEGCSGPDLISKHVLFNKSTVMCDVTVCYVTVQWRSSHVPASQCLENRGAPQRHLYSSNCSEILDIA